MSSLTPHFLALAQRWRNDPLKFVTEAIGDEPEPWQTEALTALAANDRLAIRSGHGVGKTRFLGWACWWFLCTRFPCKVPITANSQDQLRDTIWPELSAIHRRMSSRLPTLAQCYDVTAERVVMKASPDEAFAVARTASKDNPEALQGFHAEHLLFLIDEASGIPDIVFEVSMGALSTEGAKVVMPGNPTRLSGFFFDVFHTLRHRWFTMRVNSEDVPRARGHIEDVIAKFGKDSNAYRVRVLGEFPTTEDQQVIPLEWIESAIKRDVKPLPFREVWGIDVARFGDDRTALAKRKGNVVPGPVQWWRGKDTMQVAGLVKREWDLLDPIDRPSEILVDVIGLGAGVVDRLAELGLPVRGINVGEAASIDERFMRFRDELWWRAREWFGAKDVKAHDDPALVAELVAPSYGFTSSGRLLVESKDEMKKRGVRSPDLADAFCLTFAGGGERIEADERDRYARRRRSKTGWMAA